MLVISLILGPSKVLQFDDPKYIFFLFIYLFRQARISSAQTGLSFKCRFSHAYFEKGICMACWRCSYSTRGRKLEALVPQLYSWPQLQHIHRQHLVSIYICHILVYNSAQIRYTLALKQISLLLIIIRMIISCLRIKNID